MAEPGAYPRAGWTLVERAEWQRFVDDGWTPQGAGLVVDIYHAVRLAEAEARTVQRSATPAGGEGAGDG